MSLQYDEYLEKHIKAVNECYRWLQKEFPGYFEIGHDFGLGGGRGSGRYVWGSITDTHDDSKYSPEEYDAYDAYFYGGNRSFRVKEDFNRAWLHHIHNNPHHWQHWVLLEDDPEVPGELVCIEMPIRYALEMIADWWSFSWRSGNKFEIFDWYEDHKGKMKLHKNTRDFVETVLDQIKERLNERGES